MVTEALSSYGTLLKMGDGATSENFSTIAELKDIGGPSKSLGTKEVTTHVSPGRAREFIATLIDNGEVTAQINFLPSDGTHDPVTGLQSALDDAVKTNFQLVFPDDTDTTATFAAFVTAFKPAAPVDGSLDAEITLKLTGLIVWS